MADRNRDLAHHDTLEADFTDALEDFIGGGFFNFSVAVSGTTAVRVPAGAQPGAIGNIGTAAVAIKGKWRFITADQSRSMPGGATAGVYDLWVVCAANEYAAGTALTGEIDNTYYGFELRIQAQGAAAPTGSLGGGKPIAFSRLVKKVFYDGTQIVAVGDPVPVAPAPDGILIGMGMTWAGATDPAGGRFMVQDGRTIRQDQYPAFFALIGHSRNGGVAPPPIGGFPAFKIPDKRGRVPVGPDTGVATGAAGRISTAAHALAGTGGEERHLLIVSEMPAHVHQVAQRLNSTGPFDDGSHVPYASRAANLDAFGAATDSRGGDSPHNNLQPYEVDNWIVRVA